MIMTNEEYIEMIKNDPLAKKYKELMYWLTWDEIGSPVWWNIDFVVEKWEERVNDNSKIGDLEKALKIIDKGSVEVYIDAKNGILINRETGEIINR